MNIRHLRIFLTVCESGSMTQAAKQLYISQPSISLAISELEDYYGILLFDRISQRLYITQAGEKFRQYAQHVIQLLDEMESNIKTWDHTGTIRIGASVTIGNYFMPEIISTFKERFPDLEVTLQINNSDNIKAMVLENKIDVGYVEGYVKDEYLERITLLEDYLTLICAKHHPWANKQKIAPAELEKEKFLLREVGSAGRELFDSYVQLHALSITPVWESTSSQALIRGVEKNLGVSILPYLLVKDALDEGKIAAVPLEDGALSRSFSIIYHRNKFLPETFHDLVDISKDFSKTIQYHSS